MTFSQSQQSPQSNINHSHQPCSPQLQYGENLRLQMVENWNQVQQVLENQLKRKWEQVVRDEDDEEIYNTTYKKSIKFCQTLGYFQNKSDQQSNSKSIQNHLTDKISVDLIPRNKNPHPNFQNKLRKPLLITQSPTSYSPNSNPSQSTITLLPLQTRKLIYLQQKLDNHLTYMKNIRNIRGQSFTEIKRKLGSQGIFTLKIMKQILFIVPEFYELIYSIATQHQFPFLIRLPVGVRMEERKREFRKRLTEFYQKNIKIIKKDIKEPSGEQNHFVDKIDIPEVDEKFLDSKINRTAQNSEKIISQSQNQKRVLFFSDNKKKNNFSPFSILDSSQMFKSRLFQLIKEKQNSNRIKSPHQLIDNLIQPRKEPTLHQKSQNIFIKKD